MKPSLRAPVPGSVTPLKLNHWLLERKNVHICGPPGRRRAGGWASAMLRVLKARFKTLFVSAEQNFRRSQQPEQTPLPPSHPASQTSARPSRPSSREKCPQPRSLARWVDAEGRGEAGERRGWDSSCHQSRVKFVWEALSMGEIPNPLIDVE